MKKIIAVLVLAFAACGKDDLRDLERDRAAAENRAREAERAAEEAMMKVEKLERDSMELDKKVQSATDAVIAAQTDADRESAKAKLEALRKERAKFDRDVAEAKAAAAKAKRIQGRSISKECQDNPLAKGCS
jgi:hypothetical protein